MILRLIVMAVLVFLVVAAAKVIWPQGLPNHYQIGCLNEATPSGQHLFELYWRCSSASAGSSTHAHGALPTSTATANPTVVVVVVITATATPQVKTNSTTHSTTRIPQLQGTPTPQLQIASVHSHPTSPVTPLPKCTATPANVGTLPY